MKFVPLSLCWSPALLHPSRTAHRRRRRIRRRGSSCRGNELHGHQKFPSPSACGRHFFTRLGLLTEEEEGVRHVGGTNFMATRSSPLPLLAAGTSSPVSDCSQKKKKGFVMSGERTSWPPEVPLSLCWPPALLHPS